LLLVTKMSSAGPLDDEHVRVIGLAVLVLNGIETTRRTVEGSDPVTESGLVTHKIPGIGDTRRGILIEYCSL